MEEAQLSNFEEMKADSGANPEESPPKSEPVSSVIIRRQVITTAGTIEENVEEPKIEQVASEEVVKTASSTPLTRSPQQPTSVSQPFEDQSAEESYDIDASQHYTEQTIVTNGQYTETTEEYPEQPVEYTATVEVQGTLSQIQIDGGQYVEQPPEEAKVGVEYTNLDVPSSQYQGQGATPFAGDGTQFIHQPTQSFQQFQNFNIARGPEDSPPSSVLYKNDPNLGSSRMYQVWSLKGGVVFRAGMICDLLEFYLGPFD